MLIRCRFRRIEQGYEVSVRVIRQNELDIELEHYQVPELPQAFMQTYEDWKTAYLGVNNARFRLFPISSGAGGDPIEYVGRLRTLLNEWLMSGNLSNIQTKLAQYASNGEEIRILIETKEPELRMIAWQTWKVFERYFPGSEVALSTYLETTKVQKSENSVRILLVVGRDDGIEDGINKDVRTVEKLQKRGALVTTLKQPTSRKIVETLQQQSFEIFIFVGHSRSNPDRTIGSIELKPEDELKPEESLRVDLLRENLSNAVQRGLQLCVFNSCDGLGLSNYLQQDLQLPIAIIMREPVPDEVAVQFLEQFFENFAARGQSLFSAFHNARRGLEGFIKYPGINWLPIICIGQSVEPPTWKTLRYGRQPNFLSSKVILGLLVVGVGLIAAIGVLYNLYVKIPLNPSQSPTYAPPSPIKSIRDIPDPPHSPSGKTWKYSSGTSFEKITPEIDKLFLTEFKIPLKRGTIGTERASAEMLQGDFAFALLSERPKDRPNIAIQPIAKDAIAVVVDPTLPLTDLTKEQLKNIFTPNSPIKYWNQIQPNLPKLLIKPIYRPLEKSGTSNFFSEQILQSSAIQGEKVETTDEALRKIKPGSGGIYFATASEVIDQCTVKPIPIRNNDRSQPVAPYQGHLIPRDSDCQRQKVMRPDKVNLNAIQNGEYPIIRDLYIEIRHDGSDAQKLGETYFNVLKTKEGRQVLEDHGLLPSP